MTYEYEIIRKKEQSTSTWSGGTTTQLAIYPKYAEYKERNFLWRLSSARVDIEESTFTSLPGIWRHIMIIDGEMELTHEGHHSTLLKPFEQDSFSGGWTTKSFGKARDFNLMLGQGCKGWLEAIPIDKAVNTKITLNTTGTGFMNSVDAFYCAVGEVRVEIGSSEPCTLYEGDLMIIRNMESNGHANISFGCTSLKDAIIIRASIQY